MLANAAAALELILSFSLSRSCHSRPILSKFTFAWSGPERNYAVLLAHQTSSNAEAARANSAHLH